MKRFTLLFSLFALLGLFLTGCNSEPSSPTDAEAVKNASKAPPKSAGPAPASAKGGVAPPPP